MKNIILILFLFPHKTHLSINNRKAVIKSTCVKSHEIHYIKLLNPVKGCSYTKDFVTEKICDSIRYDTTYKN